MSSVLRFQVRPVAAPQEPRGLVLGFNLPTGSVGHGRHSRVRVPATLQAPYPHCLTRSDHPDLSMGHWMELGDSDPTFQRDPGDRKQPTLQISGPSFCNELEILPDAPGTSLN